MLKCHTGTHSMCQMNRILWYGVNTKTVSHLLLRLPNTKLTGRYCKASRLAVCKNYFSSKMFSGYYPEEHLEKKCIGFLLQAMGFHTQLNNSSKAQLSLPNFCKKLGFVWLLQNLSKYICDKAYYRKKRRNSL